VKVKIFRYYIFHYFRY